MRYFITQFFLPLRLAWSSIRANLGRSVLALTGILVGVFAVVAVQAFGQGVKGFLQTQVSQFGTNVLDITPKVPQKQGSGDGITNSAITTLTFGDLEAIQRLPNVDAVYAGNLGQERMSHGSNQKQVTLYGVTHTAPNIDKNIKLAEGRFFGESEENSPVVVLGSGITKTLFGDSDALGQAVRMKGQIYTVIGVLAPRGGAAFFDFDALVYIPVRTLQNRILGFSHLGFIDVRFADGEELAVKESVRQLLRTRHRTPNAEDEDFGISSPSEAQETSDSVVGVMQNLLLFLTGISLLVGGVGIMNVMYVAVAERTPEIGLRKALGATSRAVLFQFLIESVILTLFGGLLGVLVGVGFAFLLSWIFSLVGFPLTLSFQPSTFAIAFGFSGLVGLFFGIAPARKASSLQPIDALRKD
jgi:putative ABC transport system permease protein